MALETSGAFGVAAAKMIGLKALLSMIGAAILYMVMPPERLDGSFSRSEFAARLGVAVFFSILLGDWVVSVVEGLAPWLKAAQHPEPFWVASGAPGWWVSRAAALWLYNRRSKDIGELVNDARQMSGKLGQNS